MTWEVADGLDKFGTPPVGALFRALRSEFVNWPTLGALSWIGLPSRCPPRNGWPWLARLPVEVRLRNGMRAHCRLDEFSGFAEVWMYREYEVPGLRWDKLRTIVDVGANVGAAALWFASRAPQARVVAVEPAPGAVSSLVRNLAQNGLRDRVDVVPVAIGAASGTGYLAPSPSSVTASVAATSGPEGVAVPVLTLSDLFQRIGARDIDLLKLDCEGAEYEILTSADESVMRSIAVIVGEFHPGSAGRRGDLEGVLVGMGFDCEFRGGEEFGLFAAVRRPSDARSSAPARE